MVDLFIKRAENEIITAEKLKEMSEDAGVRVVKQRKPLKKR